MSGSIRLWVKFELRHAEAGTCDVYRCSSCRRRFFYAEPKVGGGATQIEPRHCPHCGQMNKKREQWT